MERRLYTEDPRSFLGHWIRETLRNAGLPQRTIFSALEIRQSRRIRGLLVEAMTRYLRWLFDNNLPNQWAQFFQTDAERRARAEEWVESLRVTMEATNDTEERVQLDNDPKAE